MTFIYKLTPVNNDRINNLSAKDESIVMEHFNYLMDLKSKGIVSTVGRTEGKEFGIVIFEAEGEPEAFEIMNNDPAVKQKVMKASLYPFKMV